MQIKHIELLTNNLFDTEAFYGGVLGFQITEKGGTSISFKVGYSSLTFRLTSGTVGIYHFAILIPKNVVPQAYQWIKSHTAVLPFNKEGDIADFTNWNAQAFYFHDHHQNILELIAHHDLPYTSHAPFSEKEMIGICEMGLVVDDVALACKKLNELYGIPYFDKGPYLPDFAVMGEEDGLLIISATGRGWLPTGQQAVQNGVKLLVEVKGEEKEIEQAHPI